MTVQGRMERGRRTALWVGLAIVVVALLAWLGLRGQDVQPLVETVQVRSEAPAAVAVTGPSPRPTLEQETTSAELKQCLVDVQAVMRQRTEELAKRDDARLQLAYALAIRHQIDPDALKSADPARIQRAWTEQGIESQRAFSRARALAPGDADIRWLFASQCGLDVACDAAKQDLMRAEPGNAAVWLMAMGWARMRKDEAAEEAAFERALKADHYDRHGGTAILAILDGYRGVRMPLTCGNEDVRKQLQAYLQQNKPATVLDFVLAQAIGQESLTLPPYAGLSRSCRPEGGMPFTASRRQGCLQLLSNVINGGDTLVEPSIALPLLIELSAGTPQASEWRERYRNHQWIWEQLALMSATSYRDNGLTPERVATGEVQALQQALQQQGRWPAPDGWLPRDATARSLIETGRLPPPMPR